MNRLFLLPLRAYTNKKHDAMDGMPFAEMAWDLFEPLPRALKMQVNYWSSKRDVLRAGVTSRRRQ